MKLITKDGKLFGKINIIDLIVIILILAVGFTFVSAKFGGKSDNATGAGEEIILEFSTDEVYDYVLKHVKEGEPLYDADHNIKIGTVKSFKTGPSNTFATTNDGQLVPSPKKGFSSLVIECSAEGAQMKDNGVDIDGVKYGVGHTLTIRAGKAKIYIKVSDIKAAQ